LSSSSSTKTTPDGSPVDQEKTKLQATLRAVNTLRTKMNLTSQQATQVVDSIENDPDYLWAKNECNLGVIKKLRVELDKKMNDSVRKILVTDPRYLLKQHYSEVQLLNIFADFLKLESGVDKLRKFVKPNHGHALVRHS